MKVENFEAAVHFYGKAIELNPANAVYFCNRYAPASWAHRRHVAPHSAQLHGRGSSRDRGSVSRACPWRRWQCCGAASGWGFFFLFLKLNVLA